MPKPYVTLSAAISIDGYIDDDSPNALELSTKEDWALVDKLRAESDAILIGAETVRRDNPKLRIKSEVLLQARLSQGKSEPAKVTLTSSGDLDAKSNFFTCGAGAKLVYCAQKNGAKLKAALGELASVISSEDLSLEFILRDLSDRGIKRLMVEGGAKINSLFISQGLFDELRLAISPMLAGKRGRVRLLDQSLAAGPELKRLRLIKTEQAGDMLVAWYKP